MSPNDLPVKKSTRNRRLIIVLLLLAVALVTVILWLAVPETGDRANAEADQPLTLWQAQNIDSYRYTLTLSCFCPQELVQPVIVEVTDGELASLTYAESGQPADPLFFENYNSIDKLHGIIADAEAQDPARLDVTYAETTGVPLNVDIDISELMADEEIRFTVEDFEQLP